MHAYPKPLRTTCSVVLGLLAAGAAPAHGAPASPNTPTDYVSMVAPYTMSPRGRWFFFGSDKRPFGMVSVFPDTKNAGQNGGGYNYRFTNVIGFCHLHNWMTVSSGQWTLCTIIGLSTATRLVVVSETARPPVAYTPLVTNTVSPVSATSTAS